MMAFSDAQTKLLSGKLSEKHVKMREQRGLRLSYIEGWHVIAEANRVFGFEGWDRETVWAECIWQDAKREPKACAYAVRVRIRVRASETIVCREGSGVGHGSGSTVGEAHEGALKEAETDATKRALATFGNLFGLALYDKEQAGVHRRNRNGYGAAVGITWRLIASTGAVLARLESPEAFCAALREQMEKSTGLDRLKALWVRNEPTLGHLLKAWPDLRTVNGTHYVEVLERLYHEHTERLGAPQLPMPKAEAAAVDKSDLSLGAPKRLRDPTHLHLVASLPCLICGRTPSQAHHLRFAQPRALGSKVSDEWTVPLCLLHHRALHDVGSEETWWREHGIDAKAEAERLWRERHAATPTDPAKQSTAAE